MQNIKIKDLADICKVSRKTIRYYEEKGLLEPYNRNQNIRYYGEDAIMRLKCICFYRNLDMSIKDIQEIMEHKSSKECLQRVLLKQKDILSKAVEEKINMRTTIDSFLSYAEYKPMNITYEELLNQDDTEQISDMILWKFNNCYQTYSITCTKKEHTLLMHTLHLFMVLICIICMIAVGIKILGLDS